MITALQVLAYIIAVISFIGFVGEKDKTQKPYLLAGVFAASALIIAIEILLK